MRIAIRADGSNVIGLGHIYNSLAVAEVLREKGVEIYFITMNFWAVVEKLRERGYAVEKISAELSEREAFEETMRILERKKTKFLITDLLEIHHDCSPELRKKGIKCISFDIMGNIVLKSDMVFNQTTLKQRFAKYVDNGITTYYLGQKYVILAQQFQGLEKTHREIGSKAEKVLVCLGGGDEFNITTRVAKILDSFYGLHATIVLGKAFTAEKELQEAIQNMKHKLLVLKDVSNMAELMLQSDLAICAGGSVLYELAITGTPALIIPMNDHQVENGEEFQELGSAVSVGIHTEVSDEKIAESTRNLLDNYS